nr:hypothetical protein [Terricaulis sp.]
GCGGESRVVEAFQAGLPALAVATALTGVLAFLAVPLTSTRRSYLSGLSAAAVAYIIVAIILVLSPLAPGFSRWLLLVVIAPVVEETCRLIAAYPNRTAQPWRGWIAFGVAYACLESGLKFGDTVALLGQMQQGWVAALVILATPIVPFLLHVFLSVLIFALLAVGVGRDKVLVAAILLHGLHNFSVIRLLPQDIPTLAVSASIRSLLFVALIWAVFEWAKRQRPAVEAAPG